MTSQNYPKLVEQAEKAVSGVKDPDLKRIAFQKILDDLLGAPLSKATAAHSPATSTSKSVAKKAAKSSKAPSGTTGYIKLLIDDGFFDKPKTITQLKAELENHGRHIPMTHLSTPLQRLCQSRVLRRQKLKTSGKETYAYSNW